MLIGGIVAITGSFLDSDAIANSVFVPAPTVEDILDNMVVGSVRRNPANPNEWLAPLSVTGFTKGAYLWQALSETGEHGFTSNALQEPPPPNRDLFRPGRAVGKDVDPHTGQLQGHLSIFYREGNEWSIRALLLVELNTTNYHLTDCAVNEERTGFICNQFQ
jgi:hypothetical protein